MRWHLRGATVVFAAILAVWLGTEARPIGQASRMPLTVAPQTVDASRQWDQTVNAMVRASKKNTLSAAAILRGC